MPTPSSRTPIRVARGTYSDLTTSLADLYEGEICYATDQDKVYVKEGSSLVAAQGTTNAVTDAVQTYTAAQRAEITDVSVGTSDTTKTLDFAASNNFELALANSATCEISNPSNLVEGQTGSIFLVQDVSGSRLLSWGTYWHWASDTPPVLTTAGGSCDRIDYIVRSSTSIHAVATLNVY